MTAQRDELVKSYFDLLCKWNKKMNLTSIDDEDGFYVKHVDDSLQVLPYLSDANRIIDLGAGAGIPGIILKIFRPELDVTLMDSVRKKISFCGEVIRRLKLVDVRAVWGRAEDEMLARSVGKFDTIISRATWELKAYLKIASLYTKPGSVVIAMKGKNWARELEKAGKICGDLSLEGTHPYKLKSGEDRCILVFR